MKTIPIADNNLVEKAEAFLKTNNLFYEFCSFHSRLFYILLNKNYSHSDLWSAVFDWLHERMDTVPEGIKTALTELYEARYIHVKKEL